MDCNCSLRTAPESTWSNRCEPPCRSRPSTTWRCAQAGQCLTTLSGKKFGTAHRHTASAVSRIATAFHRVKNNMDFDVPRYDCAPAAAKPARQSAGLAGAIVLHRLALGPHFVDHGAHLPHPHTLRGFDLDLVVIHHLFDFG